jgi:hypothetical protein
MYGEWLEGRLVYVVARRRREFNNGKTSAAIIGGRFGGAKRYLGYSNYGDEWFLYCKVRTRMIRCAQRNVIKDTKIFSSRTRVAHHQHQENRTMLVRHPAQTGHSGAWFAESGGVVNFESWSKAKTSDAETNDKQLIMQSDVAGPCTLARIYISTW